MPRELTCDESALRKEMSAFYKEQEDDPACFNDFGTLTAHVVCEQRLEIERLRTKLLNNSIDPGSWNDPLGR